MDLETLGEALDDLFNITNGGETEFFMLRLAKDKIVELSREAMKSDI